MNISRIKTGSFSCHSCLDTSGGWGILTDCSSRRAEQLAIVGLHEPWDPGFFTSGFCLLLWHWVDWGPGIDSRNRGRHPEAFSQGHHHQTPLPASQPCLAAHRVVFPMPVLPSLGFPGGASAKESACQCRNCKRCRFDPWVRKIPCRRAWKPTPVFLPGESHGESSLAGYSP